MNTFVRLSIHLLLIIFTLSLGACAQKTSSPKSPVSPTLAEHIWQKYTQSGNKSLQSFRNELSLRYGEQGNTRRVTALLWGNNAEELRLDVNAGIGVNIAKIYEGANRFLMFVPQENTAYYHEGTQKPLFSVGVPMPLGLSHLTRLLEGQYSKVFGMEHSDQVANAHLQDMLASNDIPEGSSAFVLPEGPFAGKLLIAPSGLPVYWQDDASDNAHQGWSILLSYKEQATTPYKLRIQHKESGKQAILLVKNKNFPESPFTDTQMRLTLPEEVAILPIEELHPM